MPGHTWLLYGKQQKYNIMATQSSLILWNYVFARHAWVTGCPLNKSCLWTNCLQMTNNNGINTFLEYTVHLEQSVTG